MAAELEGGVAKAARQREERYMSLASGLAWYLEARAGPGQACRDQDMGAACCMSALTTASLVRCTTNPSHVCLAHSFAPFIIFCRLPPWQGQRQLARGVRIAITARTYQYAPDVVTCGLDGAQAIGSFCLGLFNDSGWHPCVLSEMEAALSSNFVGLCRSDHRGTRLGATSRARHVWPVLPRRLVYSSRACGGFAG